MIGPRELLVVCRRPVNGGEEHVLGVVDGETDPLEIEDLLGGGAGLGLRHPHV